MAQGQEPQLCSHICWGPSWPGHLLPGYVILGRLFLLSEPVSMPVK